MARRHVRFDMNALASIAAESVGAKTCINVKKLPDGMYNKVFLLTMDDGKEVIGKVPNPNAGLPHLTTASEVATMDFARNVLHTPVPDVYAWNSRAQSNPVGAEYIIMEKVPGVQLEEFWDSMTPTDKLGVIMQIFHYQKAWSSTSFGQYGSLYYTEDAAKQHAVELTYINTDGHQVQDPRFTIGPATGRDWVDEGRDAVQCDRGPWHSLSEYRNAIGYREIAVVQGSGCLPRQMVMVCGPRLYQPTRTKKLAALQWYLRVAEFLTPTERSLMTSHIWHDDLHEGNIFVDPKEPTKVLGVIDWQSTTLAPLFDHRLDPGFLDYNGPEIEKERPELPDNFKDLSPEAKATAVKLYKDMSVLFGFRTLISRKNPLLSRAIEFRESKAFQLLHLSRRLLEVGEAHFSAILADLEETWTDLPAVCAAKVPPFPVAFSKSQVAEIEADVDAADQGIELMNQFKTRLGQLWPDKGAVRHELYDETKAQLRQLKEEVLREYAQSEGDKALFDHYWPFDD